MDKEQENIDHPFFSTLGSFEFEDNRNKKTRNPLQGIESQENVSNEDFRMFYDDIEKSSINRNRKTHLYAYAGCPVSSESTER